MAFSSAGEALLSVYTTRPCEAVPRSLCAELAQLDRASVYETEGRRFDSCIPRHLGFGSFAPSVSPLPRFQFPGLRPQRWPTACWLRESSLFCHGPRGLPVSYTHLTLPTSQYV